MSLNQIHMEIFPLVFDEKLFDFNKFYKNIATCPISDQDIKSFKAEDKLISFKIILTRRHSTKRPICKTNFKVTHEISIGVCVYAPFKKCSKPLPISIDIESNTPVSFYTTHVSSEKVEFSKDELKKFISLGDEMIEIEDNEISLMKSVTSEGFTLVGFKNKENFQVHYNIEPCFFITPNDDVVAGSTQFLEALSKKMIEHNKIGIGKFKLSDRSIQKNVAFLPQIRSRNNFVETGLYVIILPYKEEIRPLDNLNTTSSNDREIAAALDIISNFSIENFDVKYFENPSLTHFFSKLQNLAMCEVEDFVAIDFLTPDEEEISKKVDAFLNFNKVFSLLETDKNNYDNKKKAINNFVYEEERLKTPNERNIFAKEIEERIRNSPNKIKIKDLVMYCKIKNINVEKNKNKEDILLKIQKVWKEV